MGRAGVQLFINTHFLTCTLTSLHPHILTSSHPHILTPSHPHSEESTAIPGVGVDMLVKDGKLDHLKNGPMYWVDSADINPCMGEVVRTLCEHFILLFYYPPPFPSSSFLPSTLLPPPSRHCCSNNVDHTLQRSSLPLGPSSQRNQLH